MRHIPACCILVYNPIGRIAILTQIRATTLRQEAAEAIRRAILSGHLRPGQKLVESDLAQQLGVSRNPIREAFGQLEGQGLVTTVPNLGAYVANPTQEELRDAMVLRAHLERLAAHLIIAKEPTVDLGRLVEHVERAGDLVLASERVPEEAAGLFNLWDADFHRCLVECSGSQALLRTWMTASPGDLIFLHDTALSLTSSEMASILDMHRTIVTALQSRDARSVDKALAAHFRAPNRRDICLDDVTMRILDWRT